MAQINEIGSSEIFQGDMPGCCLSFPGMIIRHWEASVRVSSADWFKAGVARQRVGPTSSGIMPRACTILSKLLLHHHHKSQNYTPTHDSATVLRESGTGWLVVGISRKLPLGMYLSCRSQRGELARGAMTDNRYNVSHGTGSRVTVI